MSIQRGTLAGHDRNGSIAGLLSRMQKVWLGIILVGVIILAGALAAAVMLM